MRLIGSDTQASRIGAYLTRQKIPNTIEGEAIWIHNEDQIEEAMKILSKFQANRRSSEFDVTVEPNEEEEVIELASRPIAHMTTFLIALCAIFFFLSSMQEIPLLEKGIPPEAFVPTPVQSAMLYDVPPVVEQVAAAVEKYNPPVSKTPPPLPADLKAKIDSINTTPFWRGIGTTLLLKLTHEDPALAQGPLFVKIRQGEVWRLISPAFLHGSILHILFNMLWLWVLGKQIEVRLGIVRFLLLSLIVGVFTNTLQYLISGPFFLGYSGIIMGLAGFIWSRERVAPWEGYPLHRSIILFLVLFVVAMVALEVISITFLIFTSKSFGLGIANAAHISGAILGALLGRLNFFEAKP